MMAQTAGVSQFNEVISSQEDQVSRNKSEAIPNHFASTLQAISDQETPRSSVVENSDSQSRTGTILSSRFLSKLDSGVGPSEPLSLGVDGLKKSKIVLPISSTAMSGNEASLPFAAEEPNSVEASPAAIRETKNGESEINGSKLSNDLPVVSGFAPPSVEGVVEVAAPLSNKAEVFVAGFLGGSKGQVSKVAVSDQKAHIANHNARAIDRENSLTAEGLIQAVPIESEDKGSKPLGELHLGNQSTVSVPLSAQLMQTEHVPRPNTGKPVPPGTAAGQIVVSDQGSAPAPPKTLEVKSGKPTELLNVKLEERTVHSGVSEVVGTSTVTASSSFVPSMVTVGVTSGTVSTTTNQSSGSGVMELRTSAELQAEVSGGSLPHTMLAATPTALEIGVSSGTHGWLKIRAELTSTGEVNASLSGASIASATSLRSELPALNSYLQAEKISIGELVVHPMTHATSAASQELQGTLVDTTRTSKDGASDLAGTMADGSAGGRAGRERSEDPSSIPISGDSEPLLEARSDPSAQRDRTELGGIGSRPPFEYGTGGGWVNVRA
ncbi:hypothetical protein [Granulicella arctica]|uniref:hypothetical protein n=1 Tax=Granulicella arctica TaxID=940613 RepID=UPI0021E0F734|nr:hypothetical protein [Granulicella arctica]